jgi:hypothetical protein
MNGFLKTLSGLWVLAALVVLFSETASAQISPHRPTGSRIGNYGGGGYYGYDYAVMPDINKTNAAYQESWNQQKQYQAQVAQSQSDAWRNLNQTIAQQAATQTQTMQADRQASRDWWYQQQSRQLAESKARAAYQPMNLPASAYAGSAPAPVEQPVREIMLWPTLLKLPTFNDGRAKVETPFRRASEKKNPLAADDYRSILAAIVVMKTQLEDVSSQVLEAETAMVEGYLNELAADAQKRLDARLKPADQEEKSEPAAKP